MAVLSSISDIPGVEAKLASIKDPTQQQLARQMTTVAFEQAKAYIAEQGTILDKLAETRIKLINGTITEAEKSEYYKMKQKLQDISDKLNIAGKTAPEEVKKLKEEHLQKKLGALKGAQGHLTFSKAGDLFEYVLRTQALNPYSRERACDLEFLELLTVVAEETGQDIQKIKSLQKLIKEVF